MAWPPSRTDISASGPNGDWGCRVILNVPLADDLWSDDELRAAARSPRLQADGGRRARRSLLLEVADSRSATRRTAEEAVGGFLRVPDGEHLRRAPRAGAFWVKGCKPARNVGDGVKARMVPLLRAEGLL